jgi:hypothetical protein
MLVPVAGPDVGNARRAATLRRVGLIITLGYLLAACVYTVIEWHQVKSLAPDELATFLAGVFAPLAFLWVVLGYHQQGDELRYSADALYLQGEELRNSVEQQRELVLVSRAQLEAEVAARKDILEEAQRAAEPRLRLHSTGLAATPRGANYMYDLVNLGPTCTDVIMTKPGALGQRVNQLGPAQRMVLELEVMTGQPVEPLIIEVSFISSNGKPGNARFEISTTVIHPNTYATAYGHARIVAL